MKRHHSLTFVIYANSTHFYSRRPLREHSCSSLVNERLKRLLSLHRTINIVVFSFASLAIVSAMCQRNDIPSIDPIERLPLLRAVISYSNWFEVFCHLSVNTIQSIYIFRDFLQFVVAALLLIRCSNGRFRMHIVDIGRCKQVRTILRPFVIYFVNMVTFKLPFGRPNDAIHIRAGGSFRPNTKIVRILFFWLRLIACFARALALCLRVNGKTQ